MRTIPKNEQKVNFTQTPPKEYFRGISERPLQPE